MALTTLPAKTDASIGRVKSDLTPAPNLDQYVPASEYERLKTAVIEIAADLGVDSAPAAGSIKARLTALDGGNAGALVQGFDDFTTDPRFAWQFIADEDASIEVGMPGSDATGSGVLSLSVGTASGPDSRVSTLRHLTALALDSAQPIVLEWRFWPTGTNAGWTMGISDNHALDDGAGVVFGYLIGTGYRLGLVRDGSTTLQPITLPSTTGSVPVRARLTVSTTGVTLEAALDGGAYSQIGAIGQAPSEALYHPYIRHGIDAAAGNQTFLVDYVSWRGARLASGSPTGNGDLSEIPSTLAPPVRIRSLAGATATMAAADDGKIVRCTSSTAVTITVQPGLRPGTTTEYLQEGSGAVTILGSAVTLRHRVVFVPRTAGQWSSVRVTILDGNEAWVRGDLADAPA